VRFSFGLAATIYEPDIGSRLFHSRFPVQLAQCMEARLFREVGHAPEGDARRIIQ